MVKKFVLLFIILLLFCSVCFADGLVIKEATNYYNEGTKALKEGNFQKADTAFQKVFLVDPQNIEWKKFISNNYGIMYIKTGDMQKAEAAFNEALRIDPNYKTAELNLGLIYDMQKDELKAIKQWMKALNIKLNELKPKDFIVEEKAKTESKK